MTTPTRALMSASAAFLAALGLAASFLPQEITSYAGRSADPFTTVMIQLAGAGWVAFALVNWSARGNMIGGIYGRPIALGNLAHFGIGAIVLVKVIAMSSFNLWLLAIAAAYGALALAFVWVLFVRDPLPR